MTEAEVADGLAELAELLLQHGEIDRARALIDAIREVQPGHPALMLLTLDAAYRAQDGAGLPDTVPATSAPSSPREARLRALVLAAAGQIASARLIFKGLRQRTPTASARNQP